MCSIWPVIHGNYGYGYDTCITSHIGRDRLQMVCFGCSTPNKCTISGVLYPKQAII